MTLALIFITKRTFFDQLGINKLWKSKSRYIPCHTLQRKSHLCVPRKGIARPQSQFTHSCVCERFIYSHNRVLPILLQENIWPDLGNTVYFKNRSHTHECGNWDWGRAIPFLEMRNWDFCCSAKSELYKECSVLLLSSSRRNAPKK